MHQVAEQFIHALEELHRDKKVDDLVGLFSQDATLQKVGMPHGERGQDGARTFWEQYRGVFDEIDAEFSHIVTEDDITYLEWTSRGTLHGGEKFSYDGVSVLEFHGEAIAAFRTFYDTAAFLEHRSAG
jgi:ketosteroid isomerase-like protein